MPLIPMGTRCQRGLASWPGLPAARHLPALCCAAAWRRPGRVHAHRQCADDRLEDDQCADDQAGREGGRQRPPARARARHENVWSPRTKFFLHYTSRMFRDLPVRARELKATPEMLERIYDAARLGLRGESLALAAGMLPVELARLKIMDPIAEVAEMKGRADSEMEMSRVVFDAAQAGDSKAALEFLKHRHEWVAKTNVQVDVNTQISVVAALEAANGRLQRGLAVEVEDAVEVTGSARAGKIAAPAAAGIAPAALPAKEPVYAERPDER